MGEVYRATDSKLKREVAIKVLPAAFAEDKERLARFEREAQVLAQLHHPNIASIFGLEESNGVRALVMELVDGEELAQVMARGPLPLAEALAIARQIAEALEAAHERGIVHRDLKPANVKVQPDGALKVLDFGLAKALDPAAGASGSAALASPTLMNSPTLTGIAGTQLGMILGTAAYMAPEQAAGKPIDRRVDIWAFGVVLWEMLSGRRLFAGDSVPETLGAIFRQDIEWTALPPETPASVRRLVERCLARDPKQRLRDIGEARIALASPSAVEAPPASATPATVASVTERPRRSPLTTALPWASAAAMALVAVWLGFARRPVPAAPDEVTRLEIGYPSDVEPILGGLSGSFAISPDGRYVAMIGVRASVRRLYLRRLDRAEATEVADSGGANSVTFSPDSTSLVFVPGSAQVTRLSLVDQQRAIVATGADLQSSVAWGPSGIVFERRGELWIVPAAGGAARQLTHLDAARHEVVHTDQIELPGVRKVLFSSLSMDAGAERVEAVGIEDGARSVVVERAVAPSWSPTGHLLFGRDGAIFAATFDPAKATLTGPAVPVVAAADVGAVRLGRPGYQLSASGTLLVAPPQFDKNRLVLVARDGAEQSFNGGLDRSAGRMAFPRISPDGRRLLLERASSVIEVLDLARGTSSQLSAATLGSGFPTWTSDGARVVFRRLFVPYWVATDGSGQDGVVPFGDINDYASAPGPDPDSFVAARIRPDTAGDVYLMSLSGRYPPKSLLATPAYEGGPELSPDARWLIYQSNVSGQPEIYVRRYPALDRAWQVSEAGGVQTRWSADGREIFYRGAGHINAVAFDGRGESPVLGRPSPLFADEYDFGQGLSVANYDALPGGRFALFRRDPGGGRFRVALHWTSELERLVASGGLR